MDHHEHNDADAWAYRADADYTFDNSDWLDKIRFGVRYEDYNSTTRETGYRWGSISQNWAGGPAVFGAQNVPFASRTIRTGSTAASCPSGFLFPNTSFFRNYQTWSDTVVDVSTAPGVNNGCCSWVPWDGDYSTKFPANDGLGVNPQNQTDDRGVYAAVLQARQVGRQRRRPLREDRSLGHRPAGVLGRQLRAGRAGR